MNSSFAKPRSFEFCFIELDYTLVRVEETEGHVLIRATADTFSMGRKLAFIKELAAEGFIPDEFQWFNFGGYDFAPQNLVWRVDGRWLKHDASLGARNWRITRKFILPAALLWFVMIYAIFPTHAKAEPARVDERTAPSLHLQNRRDDRGQR